MHFTFYMRAFSKDNSMGSVPLFILLFLFFSVHSFSLGEWRHTAYAWRAMWNVKHSTLIYFSFCVLQCFNNCENIQNSKENCYLFIQKWKGNVFFILLLFGRARVCFALKCISIENIHCLESHTHTYRSNNRTLLYLHELQGMFPAAAACYCCGCFAHCCWRPTWPPYDDASPRSQLMSSPSIRSFITLNSNAQYRRRRKLMAVDVLICDPCSPSHSVLHLSHA